LWFSAIFKPAIPKDLSNIFENNMLKIEVGRTMVTNKYPMFMGAPAIFFTIPKNIDPLSMVERKTAMDNFITFILFLLKVMQIKWKNILVIILSTKFASWPPGIPVVMAVMIPAAVPMAMVDFKSEHKIIDINMVASKKSGLTPKSRGGQI